MNWRHRSDSAKGGRLPSQPAPRSREATPQVHFNYRYDQHSALDHDVLKAITPAHEHGSTVESEGGNGVVRLGAGIVGAIGPDRNARDR
jgi:hypothetical protein